MARVNIDGKDYDLKEGQNLLHAVLSEHLDLPYFCWHPAMGSVGSCRLCAVIQYADEGDERGRLQMACMMTVQDGLRVSIGAPGREGPGAFAASFRKQVIEWLMENHPHDCPVCEEGGECHLQDMTVMAGHTSRRYAGAKRTFRNQYLGPFIGHEMNRCITCYRCVRYYRDYAGGTDLDAFGSRARMFFGRQEDGVLESEFAGNLVEVCPTGVFTDKPFSATYTRKWDLQSAPSVCPGCAVGCNTLPGERYGSLKRVHNRYHPEVNGYFLCDRGRFGSHFVNSDARLRQAGAKAADGVFEALDSEAATKRLAEILKSGDVIGIGSPRASMESNHSLKRLVGDDNFSGGIAAAEAELNQLALAIMQAGGARLATVKEAEAADAVLVLGEDIANTAPRIALALRQSARNLSLEMAAQAGIPLWQEAGVRGHAQQASNPFLIATPAPTRLDDLATGVLRRSPEAIAQAGFAIAHAIDGSFATAVASPASAADAPAQQAETSAKDAIDAPAQAEQSAQAQPTAGDAAEQFIAEAVEALSQAQRPLVVTGTAAASPDVLKAAANIAWALTQQGKDAGLLIAGKEANSMGVTLLDSGLTLEAALERLANGNASAAIVLENDLYRRLPAELVDQALSAASHLVVLDVLETATAEAAALALPAASYAESTGTFINHEGRAQRFYQVFEPEGGVAPAWRWLADAAQAAGRNDLNFSQIDEATAACAASSPALAGMADAAPAAGYRTGAQQRVARMTHRASGRTAQTANLSVHEPKTSIDEQTPFSYSMEGANDAQPGALIPFVWSPGWNSNQSLFKFQQEVGGPLQGGEGGARLIDPKAHGAGNGLAARFRDPPAAVAAKGGLRLTPLHPVFGSEELSNHSPPVAERSGHPEVLLHPHDAAALGLAAGQGARIQSIGVANLAVTIEPSMAVGCAAVTLGMAGGPKVLPGLVGALERDPDFVAPQAPELIAKG